MPKVTLTHDRSTKGTHVFKDDAENAPIRSLYITRGALGEGDGEAPKKVDVTFEPAAKKEKEKK
jgi:hypothetical protein